MRQAPTLVFVLALLAACEPNANNANIDPVTVQWMDWPAEVNAGQPFRTRLVVWNVCGINPQFRAGASADQAAVTFAPYFLVDNDHIECLTDRTGALLVLAIDTAGLAPGLTAASARTYEMRAPSISLAYSTLAQSAWTCRPGTPCNIPVSTFGEVIVRPNGADTSRRNAAGYVNVERDSLNCARVRPMGLYAPKAALVLEDQADTAGISFAFVKGYIHDATAPVCGETKVFHLLSRN